MGRRSLAPSPAIRPVAPATPDPPVAIGDEIGTSAALPDVAAYQTITVD